MLKRIGPNIESWGTPKSISYQELYDWFILVLFFRLVKWLWMRFRAAKLKPYESNLNFIKSFGRYSNALERSVRRAPNTFPLSTFFHFSTIAERQCCALYPFLNRNWYLERNLSTYIIICFDSNFSNILDITGSILTGR